jgi:ribosome-associated protein
MKTLPAELPEPPEQIRLAVDAALDRKAEDVKVLHLAPVSDFTDHFLIISGTNERQVQAIVDSILERLRAAGVRPLHVEGYDHAHWVLLDIGGDMVIHVFLDESRRFYGLEGLWADAAEITAEFV